MSNQRFIQSYLERHEIGKLFENMMAKLIKEMPNEPISYLIRLLQRFNSSNDISGMTFPSSVSYKPDMGLRGSAVPKKYSQDPQVILPGSKPVTSVWMESPDSEGRTLQRNENIINSRRSKSRSAGSKQSKSDRMNKDYVKTEPVSWNADSKLSNKSFDDMFHQEREEPKKHILSKSHQSMSPKELQRYKKTRDGSWSEDAIEEKENSISLSNALENNPIIKIERSNGIGGDDDDELHVSSRPNYDNKKKTCSSTRYSKYKRKSSKKKSLEHKQKLQALLSVDPNKSPKGENIGDSTDYDGDEILEDSNELLVEGANPRNCCKKTVIYKPQTENVKVFICSTCAKVIGDKNHRVKTDNNRSSVSDDEEFESVSQVDPEKPYKPVWYPVVNSETEEVIDRTEKMRASDSPKKGIFRYSQSGDDEKSDFFIVNNPANKRTKQFTCYTSDNDSEVINQSLKTSIAEKKGWEQRMVDTGSEADVDEESELNGYG